MTLLFAVMSEVLPVEVHGDALGVGDLDLWVETAGQAGPAVVLLAGSDAPGYTWPDSFRSALVADGFRVIRFDYRDCGRSTRLSPPYQYSLADLAADVVAMLDQLAIPRAHLIGFSMGAMVSQVLALDHGPRVASLTLLAATPGAGDERLSGPDPGFLERIVDRHLEGPPSDADGAVDWLIELSELLAGSEEWIDPATDRALAERLRRDGRLDGSGHGEAIHQSASRLDRLGQIGQPTLVVHGSADPVYPVDHGRALTDGIDGAVLVEVDGLGHIAPEPLLRRLRPIIVEHLRASE